MSNLPSNVIMFPRRPADLAPEQTAVTATVRRKRRAKREEQEVLTGVVVDAIVRGRIERGEREVFDRVTCLRGGRTSGDLAHACGELVIETFEGRVESATFTPDDEDLPDAEICPKDVIRNGPTIEIVSDRSHWVFVVED